MRTKEEIRAFYNKAYSAGYGGDIPLSERYGTGSNLKATLKDFKALDEHSVVLEIGCGEGKQMEPTSRSVKEVHGVDISDVAIETAKIFLAERDNCFLYVNDNIEFFPDEHFDAIWEQTVFQHMIKKHVLEYIDQSARKLKMGGYASFQFNHSNQFDEREAEGRENQSSWTKEEFTGALTNVGLHPVKWQSVQVGSSTMVYYVIARKT